MSELPKRIPTEYDVNGNTHPGVKETFLGVNADFTRSTLPSFIDFDGIQIHPSRIHTSNTLPYNLESEKNNLFDELVALPTWHQFWDAAAILFNWDKQIKELHERSHLRSNQPTPSTTEVSK